ncbi:hypothetical protein CE557_643 [Cardinium endosymbiont of Sogatella furcifera]|uniref:hypothetical protein n=1 Tax=Cardinium endosymbiont of Sogatella furcifera TaxID=650378 RepID=UPI000E0D9237|nr:hypothetical protein [Cardinium endosymbiont of Sogatella furcifera]AXI24444.1 hypothetical protein CE557_643 [Cardinium endosymbiont of Sogatella furcifera]
MKKIIIINLISLCGLMGFKCKHVDATIPVVEQTASKISLTSNRTKPSAHNHLTGDDAIVHPIVSYDVKNDQLSRYYLFKPTPASGLDHALWEEENHNKASHQKLFNWFAKIIPQQYREGIKYFAIIDPRQSNAEEVVCAAIGPQSQASIEPFCLYMAFDLEGYRDLPYLLSDNSLSCNWLVYILLHEFGHYLTMNEAQQALIEGAFVPKKNSICEQIWFRPAYKKLATCSNEVALARCKEELFKQGEFITEYAANSCLEDAAETFAYFVLTDERPQPGVSGAKDKILLFYENEQMVNIREDIRENLKKLGIAPRVSNILIHCSKLLTKAKEKLKKLIGRAM